MLPSVRAAKSMKNWTSPALFSVPSTLYSFQGSFILFIGSFAHRAYIRSMKFSVAPESRKAVVSALFMAECR